MKIPRKIILASASPSLRELLEKIGLPFIVEVSGYEEDKTVSASPHALVQLLSQGKARAVAHHHKNALVIGADSMAVLDNELLGKPTDTADARRMLLKMRGRAHSFITGFTIIDTKNKKEVTKCVESTVHLRRLSEKEIDAYIASGEPFGHAGSYNLADLGMVLVEKIDGDYANVTGLPVSVVVETLKEFGVQVL